MGLGADLLLLAAGLLLIIKGGDLFVASAVRLAEFLGMPRVVIGSTLVSLATTTPELVVSIMSGVKGTPGLAVGNAVGSVVCNIGLILGITALIKQVEIQASTLRVPILVMFGVGVALFFMTWDLALSAEQGIVLLVMGVAYFAWDFWRHWRTRKPREVIEALTIEKSVAATRFPWLQTAPGTVTQFVAGAGIVLLGSRLLVDAAVNVSGRLGIPPMIVGLTVVAVGTSLPELVTAITSSRKSVSELAVGNVLGANIANLTFIVGTAAVLQDVTLDRLTQLFNFPAMIVMMLLLFWILWTDRRITRREGVTLLACYSLYLATLILITILAAA